MVRKRTSGTAECAKLLFRDQEMRFTVHDSPDYYQLKVSVFNDDKKTELIGETWIALDKIIGPGGGQNDLWHQLNWKGKYAGEIRIELTYYDTRPKDEKVEEKRQATPVNGSAENPVREGVGGPRQHKVPKRRPLPADPTKHNHTQSSPAAYTLPPQNDQTPSRMSQGVDQGADHRIEVTPQSNTHHHQLQAYDERGQPLSDQHDAYSSYDPYDQPLAFSTSSMPQNHSIESRPHLPYQEVEQNDHRPSIPRNSDHESHARHYAPELDQQDSRNSLPRRSDYETHNRNPSMAHDTHDHNSSLQRSSEHEVPSRHHSMDAGQHDYRTSTSRNLAFETPIRHYSTGAEHHSHRNSLPRSSEYETPVRHPSLGANDNWSSPVQPIIDNESPPPPPAHRSSGLQSPTQPGGRAHPDTYPPLSAPAPLKIRNHKGSASASPLSQVHSNDPTGRYVSSAPIAASVPSYTAYSLPDQRRSQTLLSESPTRELGYDLPPSLIPGYGSSIVQDEPEEIFDQNLIGSGQVRSRESSTQHQVMAAHNAQPSAYPSPSYNTYSAPRNDPYASPRTEGQSPLRLLENGSQERTPQSSSTPITMKPLPITPDPRAPARKPVSPAPERRLSAIPFSPDSYDAFNPSASSSPMINSAGPKYKTPDQAREAQREREKELRLDEGPIISHNGRVIDPSDHLPTDTWAPEPESKQPRRGPEVTLRFRHSPQGAQPMPPSGTRRAIQDTPTRPHSIGTPIYAHSPEPTSAGRNRLLKKSRVSPAHPASSPSVPTLANENSYTSRMAMTRASKTEYPIREYGNGSDGSPGSNMRDSPGLPPPVPGKIPISAGPRNDDDMSLSVLSEEMRRIDIGVGGGQPRSRRSRFGP